MRPVFIALLLAVACPVSVTSQIYFSEPIDEDLLKGRVKQVEEFMARFNYEEDWEGRRVENVADTFMRAKYLHTLFDYGRFRQDDGQLTAEAERFIQEVVSQGYLLHFSDSTWMARVGCKVLVNGKSHSITLSLRTQQVAPNEYIWVIVDVSSPLFAPNGRPASHPFISPVEHEIGFTGLLSLPTTKNQDVSRLFPPGRASDKLSMLAALLTNGMIKFTNIDDVSYHFQTVPHYEFSIERVERKDSFNTGWLITSLHSL